MKIIRSSKCSLKFSTHAKLDKLNQLLAEYSKVVNFFIEKFWEITPTKGQLLKQIVNLPTTWLSARLRKVAAREAIDMILSSKNKENERARTFKPRHYGKSMSVSSTIASLQTKKDAKTYDCWLHIASVGDGIILDLPVKLHKHFHELKSKGRRMESFVIKSNCVQFCFEIETGPKKTEGKVLGIDTGINALASTSDNRQYGTDVKGLVESIKRKKHGSHAQQRARRSLRQRMDEVAKEVVQDAKMVVVEDLKKMNHNSKVKRRLTKNMRRSLGAWAYRYWLNRISLTCENNRVAYRKVNPAYTSQRCHACGHTERGNRDGEKFLCLKCGHADNADLNAAKNIEFRYTSGPYGAASKLDKGLFCPSGKIFQL